VLNVLKYEIVKKMKKLIALAILILFILVLIIYFIPEKRNVIKTQHFTFLFGNSIDSGTIIQLGNALEDNYSRIGYDLETMPSENIETNVYSTRWRYIKATGNWSASGNIEGVSKLHFLQQAWGESDSKKIAVHEFAHTVTLKLLIYNEPQPVQSK